MDSDIKNLLVNHVAIIVIFIIIYSILHKYDKDSFTGIDTFVDVISYTTGTHVTATQNIHPKSQLAKVITSVQNLCTILLSIHLIYSFIQMGK